MPEIKFKKSTYQITINNDPWDIKKSKTSEKSIKGQITNNFGVNYRTDEMPWYTVTHLNTGCKVRHFKYLHQAKKFIKKLEAIPDIDSMNLMNFKSYVPNIQEIINSGDF